MTLRVSSEDLAAILRMAVAELAQLPSEDVAFDRPLRELGVDSLMALELVVRMEQKFKVRLSDQEIQTVRTINDMLALAAQKMSAA